MPTRLGESQGAGAADQIGLIRQVGEECVEFVLDTGFEAGVHRHDQDREGQDTVADESVWLETGVGEEFVGMGVICNSDKNALVLRSSW